MGQYPLSCLSQAIMAHWPHPSLARPFLQGLACGGPGACHGLLSAPACLGKDKSDRFQAMACTPAGRGQVQACLPEHCRAVPSLSHGTSPRT